VYKPNAFRSFCHWVQNVKGGWASIKEDIIVILDPDEFFLSPLKTGVPAMDLIVKVSGEWAPSAGSADNVLDLSTHCLTYFDLLYCHLCIWISSPKTSPGALKKIVDDVNFPDRVKPGTAVAQQYGLGAGWVQPGKFDRVKICGADSYCTKVTLYSL
jgi:hypothetical protein